MAELSAGVNNAFDQHPVLWTPAFARQVYIGARMKWDRRPAGGDVAQATKNGAEAGASAK